MKKISLFLIMLFSCLYATAQTNDVKDSVIIGPKKYLSEIIRIMKKYDTVQTDTGSSDQGMSLDKELNELKIVLQKFTNVTRVSAFNKMNDNNRRETSYFVFFESEIDLHRNFSVKWTIPTK